MRLDRQAAIVTGGANGIGRATAIKFGEEGAKVVIWDIDTDGIDETLAIIRDRGGEGFGVRVDVADPADVDHAAERVLVRYGHIDVLVNNAGIVMHAQVAKLVEDQWNRVIAVNLTGAYHCTRALADSMCSRRHGVILNVAAVAGLYGSAGQTDYAASGAGVVAMTKTWAKELGPKGVRCNVVCPGFVSTHVLDSMPEKLIRTLADRIPLGRFGRPGEVASVLAFLASEEASYVNGAVIEVSGGVTL
jgi:3-oxoacyl-[acyl-carrier protein] reductase